MKFSDIEAFIDSYIQLVLTFPQLIWKLILFDSLFSMTEPTPTKRKFEEASNVAETTNGNNADVTVKT